MSDFPNDPLPNDPWGGAKPTDEPSEASSKESKPEQMAAESEQSRAVMHRISRKSFIWAGVSVLGAYGGFRWISTRRSVDGTPWPFRAAFQVNEQIQRDLFSDRLAPTFDPSRATEPKLNLLDEEENQDDIDVADWRLTVEGLYGHDKPLVLTMDQLKRLPIVEQTTALNCIEGWSSIVSWKGIRFRDLATHLGAATVSGEAPDLHRKPEDLLEYVGIETVEGLYYVGLDTLSAIHPQTLLAFEMNGQPLSTEHGFPLRLVIPSKYGIKNIKRIGKITFTAIRPRDYWAEQGYDWYSGL